MSISESRLAYQDCYEVFEQALADEEGVRVQVPSANAATFLRMRLHQARKINRRDNAQTYAKDSPLHGASPYDKLVVRLREIDGRHYVYIEHGGIDLELIEKLSDVPALEYEPPEALPEPPPQLMIEHIKRRL